MTDKKISDLSANSSLSGSEYVELVQSGANGTNSSNDGYIGAAQTGAAGGAAGNAIVGNSLITWLATGTIYGTIV